jgi:hypothetical protein
VAERGITLNFTRGARVGLLEGEAAWLRDELLGSEVRSPKRDAGIVIDRALMALDENTERSPADMTPSHVVELAWALRGMLERDSDRFIGSPLLIHLRDLLFIEPERGREERDADSRATTRGRHTRRSRGGQGIYGGGQGIYARTNV